MAAKKSSSSLDRVLGRLDTLDAVNLANLVQRLARERTLLESVFNLLQEGILVISATGDIDYANAAARRFTGLRDDESGARTTIWRLVPGLRASLGDAFDGAAALPVVARELELSYPEPRIVRLYLVPFAGEGRGAERRFAVILTDITSDRLSTEQRIEDERLSSLTLLAAGVAHELGNPLNSLTIHLQLIERRLQKLRATAAATAAGAASSGATGAAVRAAKSSSRAGAKGAPPDPVSEVESLTSSIHVCQEEVKRLDGIIRNFLEAIRPRPPDLADTDLLHVLDEVLRFSQRELEDRRIAVEAEAHGRLPLVAADSGQLKQVFFNLIKNAMEAMQPGGTLRIRSYADDDSVYLAFADTGSGIRQEDLAKLFQPYHTTKSGGSGLGLMIVQRIMRGHGGHVGIESQEGTGTIVTLQFPQKHRRVRLLPS